MDEGPPTRAYLAIWVYGDCQKLLSPMTTGMGTEHWKLVAPLSEKHQRALTVLACPTVICLGLCWSYLVNCASPAPLSSRTEDSP